MSTDGSRVRHRPRVFKTNGKRPWNVICPCGAWQQGSRWRDVFDWADEHARTGRVPATLGS